MCNRFNLKKILVLLFLLAASAVPAMAQDPATLLNPDLQYSLPSGAVFNVPKGWIVQPKDGYFILRDPDQQLTLVVAESGEVDGQDAIRKAWKNYNPDFSSAIIHVDRYPKGEEWDEIYRQWYFVPSKMDIYKADEKRGLFATSKRRNGRWYVGLLDYDKASADKRQAQIETILGSVKTPADSIPTPTPQAVPMDARFFRTFEDFVEQARGRCKVPGAAVAVVKDGQVVYEKGFGVREKGKKDPVTAKTLFSIASMTKPLTTLLMARMVDAGKLDWDTPVTQLLPGFQLADPKTTAELTLKYTVCACAGLPRQDMEMVFTTGYASPEDVIEKMHAMAPTTGFGETFQYSNLMVAAGGFAAAHVLHPELSLGQAYAAAMQEYVFGPLGMTDTTLDFQAVPSKDYGSPHCYDKDLNYVAVPLDYNNWIIPVAPAAGVWSNVGDLAKYLLLELAKGTGPDGARIVSEANLLKRREPQVKISEKSTYGLGLMVSDHQGLTVVGHGGNSTGYTSDMYFFPSQNTGVVLLTNADHAEIFRGAVFRKFAELVSGRKPNAQEFLDTSLRSWEAEAEKLSGWADRQFSQSWFYNFVGNYVNPDLGPVSLKMTQEGGIFDAGKWKSHVTGYEGQGGEVFFNLLDPPLTWAGFALNDQDGHKTMTYRTPQKDYIFEQVPKGR